MTVENYIDIIPRIACVILAVHILGALIIRAIHGLSVWNERTIDVFLRDATSAGIVVVATGGAILGFDFSEVTGVMLLGVMLIMHKVVFKVYKDPEVDTRKQA